MAFRRGSRTGVQKREFTESMDVAETPSFAANAAGYLEKRAKTPPYLWQKRYFKASGHYLRYYGDEGCAVLLAAIELRGAAVAEAGPRALAITTAGGEKILLRAKDEADAQEWVAALVVLQRGLEAAGEARARRVLSFPFASPTCSFLPRRPSALSFLVPPRRPPSQVSTPLDVPALARKSEAVIKVDRSGSGAGAPEEYRDSMLVAPRASCPAAAAGYLHKKASSAFAGWQLRFFVAVGHYLRYYASDEPGSPVLGAYDVAAVEVVGSGAGDADDDGVVATFALRMADGNVQLRAATADERAQWVSALRAMQARVRDATPEERAAIAAEDVAVEDAAAPPETAAADGGGAADRPPPPPDAAPAPDRRRVCGQCAIF